MCLSYPALVLSVDPGGAVLRGEKRDFRALTTVLPDVAPGDYVVVAAGMVLERIDQTEAAEIRRLIENAVRDEFAGRAAAAGGSPDEAA